MIIDIQVTWFNSIQHNEEELEGENERCPL